MANPQHLFWDSDDPESRSTDLPDIVERYAELEVVRVLRAVTLPDVWAFHHNGKEYVFDSEAEATEKSTALLGGSNG